MTGVADDEIADGDAMLTVEVAVDADTSDAAYGDVSARHVLVTNRSHISRTEFVLRAVGRTTDYVDVESLTGNANFDVELRAADGALLSPVRGSRISFAGYPAGVYEVWANDDRENYRITPSPTFGQATTEPAMQAIDIDGSGEFNFANDGILILAWAFGGRDEALTAFRSSHSTMTGTEIETAFDLLADSLDLDGDGEFRFANDGLILLAYAFGSRGVQLEAIRAAGATRTGAQIEARIQGLLTKATSSPTARKQTPMTADSSEVSQVGDATVAEGVITLRTSTPETRDPGRSRAETPTPRRIGIDQQHATSSDSQVGEPTWIADDRVSRTVEVPQSPELVDTVFLATGDLATLLLAPTE